MKVEFGIMSSKWSVEADNKLVCYAAIVIYLGNNGLNTVVLYNEECKDDQWAFSENLEERLKEVFGGDVLQFIDNHIEEIQAACETIKRIV